MKIGVCAMLLGELEKKRCRSAGTRTRGGRAEKRTYRAHAVEVSVIVVVGEGGYEEYDLCADDGVDVACAVHGCCVGRATRSPPAASGGAGPHSSLPPRRRG
jgi:hypothetical protein